MLSEGSSFKGSPEDKQPSGPYMKRSAKISWRVTLTHYTGDPVPSYSTLWNMSTRALRKHYRVQWHNIVGKIPWLTGQNHLSQDELRRFYQEPGPDTPLELEQATEDVYHRQVEDAAQRESSDHSLPPSRTHEAETQNSPGLQTPPHEDQQGSQPPEQEDRPHKFQPGPNWHMVTPSQTGSSTKEAQPAEMSPGLDPLDKELRKEDVNDILGNYFEEQQTFVRDLIHANPGLTRSESPEAMDINLMLPSEVITEDPPQTVADSQDQAMETEPTETSPGTFQPELGMHGYTPSLIGSTNTPLSPITAEHNALLDTDPNVPDQGQSKASGAGQPEGSLKSKMTLRKRKQP